MLLKYMTNSVAIILLMIFCKKNIKSVKRLPTIQEYFHRMCNIKTNNARVKKGIE